MLVVFVLFVVSLGIYYFIWYYRINAELRDLGRAAGDAELGRVRPGIALLAVTVGSIVLVPAVVSVVRTFGRIRRSQELLELREELDQRVGIVLFAAALLAATVASLPLAYGLKLAFATAGLAVLAMKLAYTQRHLNRLASSAAAEFASEFGYAAPNANGG